MVKKWNVVIPKLSGDKPRKAYIYLPDSYEKNPDKRYPVMYMFDGHNVFFDQGHANLERLHALDKRIQAGQVIF